MNQLAYDPATDQLVYSPATGQLALDCRAAWKLTPCVESAGTCEDCTIAPEFITLTLAGITACVGCFVDRGSAPSMDSIAVGGLNGQHVLAKVSGLCEWRLANAGSLSMKLYGNDNCDGVVNPYVSDWRISLSRSPPAWILQVFESVVSGLNIWGFYDRLTLDCDDSEGQIFTNELVPTGIPPHACGIVPMSIPL